MPGRSSIDTTFSDDQTDQSDLLRPSLDDFLEENDITVDRSASQVDSSSNAAYQRIYDQGSTIASSVFTNTKNSIQSAFTCCIPINRKNKKSRNTAYSTLQSDLDSVVFDNDAMELSEPPPYSEIDPNAISSNDHDKSHQLKTLERDGKKPTSNPYDDTEVTMSFDTVHEPSSSSSKRNGIDEDIDEEESNRQRMMKAMMYLLGGNGSGKDLSKSFRSGGHQ
ncbi:uncharacterized protein L201_005843 [Kwoniella dendrophila CBS 6074]|uniref:Uncharacterized protein n=1 Tax=Kwoniella dendrophila CBS 6074 TaxID=1295534 RepID=A0AAX4K2C0_9TREE